LAIGYWLLAIGKLNTEQQNYAPTRVYFLFSLFSVLFGLMANS